MTSRVLPIYPTLQGSGDTDTEKQLHKLELENDGLQQNLMDSQRKLTAIQCENSSSENDTERLMKVRKTCWHLVLGIGNVFMIDHWFI